MLFNFGGKEYFGSREQIIKQLREADVGTIWCQGGWNKGVFSGTLRYTGVEYEVTCYDVKTGLIDAIIKTVPVIVNGKEFTSGEELYTEIYDYIKGYEIRIQGKCAWVLDYQVIFDTTLDVDTMCSYVYHAVVRMVINGV